MTVLIVDDEVEVGRALRRLLRKTFSVELASSGGEALERLDRGRVDMVISDFRMPVMNGAELLVAVKARCPRALRVMLSGYSDIEPQASLESEGVRCFRKPWDDLELLTALRLLVGLSHG